MGISVYDIGANKIEKLLIENNIGDSRIRLF